MEEEAPRCVLACCLSLSLQQLHARHEDWLLTAGVKARDVQLAARALQNQHHQQQQASSQGGAGSNSKDSNAGYASVGSRSAGMPPAGVTALSVGTTVSAGVMGGGGGGRGGSMPVLSLTASPPAGLEQVEIPSSIKVRRVCKPLRLYAYMMNQKVTSSIKAGQGLRRWAQDPGYMLHLSMLELR